MFPGQSSCTPSMLRRALALSETGSVALDVACEVLGEDLRARFAGPTGVRPQNNRDVQLSVFLTSHLHLLALAERGIEAELSLGLSLGEYNHLVHRGALPFEDAVALVAARGDAYDRGPRGMMAAVVGVERDVVEVAIAGQNGVEISNFNGPTQHVIAGPSVGVEAVSQRLEEEHYAVAVVIEPHVPMHVSLFEPAAAAFAPALDRVRWAASTEGYFPNVDGEPRPSADPVAIAESLRAHVHRPVQWARSMDWIAARHPEATLVEVGPGGVLCGLARRGWSQLRREQTDDEAAPREHIEALVRRLSDVA